MSTKSEGLSEELYAYLLKMGTREPDILRRLREETASNPRAMMQIAPEQGQFMAFLVKALGVNRYLEVGTFTGYSSLVVTLAMPPHGHSTCCDVSEEWTNVARRYWTEAGVADRIDLHLAPALETLQQLIDKRVDSFDFAFIDADKENYPAYYDLVFQLIRPGGVIAVDNVFSGGAVSDPARTDPSVVAIRELNEIIAADSRVDISTIPIADGLTLARKR
jgi:caffeoyl-CoA O-methyltransferase